MAKLKTSFFGVSLLVLSLSAVASTAQVAQPNGFPAVNPPLSSTIPLSQRLNTIGDQKITDIARWYGWSKDQFLNELNLNVDGGGSDIRLDADGRLFVVERGIPGSLPTPKQKPYHLGPEAAYTFESKPGASKTIYLSFDNARLEGTRWSRNSALVLPGFSLDLTQPGNAGGEHDRSKQEVFRILQIAGVVAEDFAPFDVNVTTKRPPPDTLVRANAQDTQYGTTVHVYTERGMRCACDTVRAYIRSFGEQDEALKPILINSHWLLNGDANVVAGAISYAIGHAMGLRRDTEIMFPDAPIQGYQLKFTESWAPIMGDYRSATVRQFSKSEDLPATKNLDESEDEIKVLVRNGLPIRPDDYGGDRFRAKDVPLTLDGAASTNQMIEQHGATVQGIIERTLDADVFHIVSDSGRIEASVTPSDYGPNANLELALTNSDGVPLVKVNPLDSAGASLSHTVTAGSYYISVRGAGAGEATSNNSTYGSLGGYKLSIAAPPSSLKGPNAVLTASAESIQANQPVTFDASGSTDDKPGLQYRWDLGNGTVRNFSASATAVATYAKPGTYTAIVMVRDSDRLVSTTTKKITVTKQASLIAPTAAFTANRTSGPATLTVVFDASASSDDGKIVKYSWDFGDGSAEGLLHRYGQDIKNQTTPIIGHYFFEPGTYNVTLTTTDDTGQVSSPARQTITVTAPNQAPVANDFSTKVRMGARNTLDVDASSSTDDAGIVSYRWDWGDGSTPTVSSSPAVSHVFPSDGSFTVGLTVTDAEGYSNIRRKVVYIPRGMQPSMEVVDHSPTSGPEIVVLPTLNGGYIADSLIFLRDGQYNPVGGAEVHWTLEGSENASGTVMSNKSGIARIDLPLPKSRAAYGALCLRLNIVSVLKPGYHYEPVTQPVRTYCAPRVDADYPVVQVTSSNGENVATARVTVRDQLGNPAPGVLVSGSWPGLTDNASATTDSTGVAELQVRSATKKCFGFMLSAISQPGGGSSEAFGLGYGCAPGTQPPVVSIQ
jgi:PKD repeat protein